MGKRKAVREPEPMALNQSGYKLGQKQESHSPVGEGFQWYQKGGKSRVALVSPNAESRQTPWTQFQGPGHVPPNQAKSS